MVFFAKTMILFVPILDFSLQFLPTFYLVKNRLFLFRLHANISYHCPKYRHLSMKQINGFFLVVVACVSLTTYTHAQHEFSIAVGANTSPITGPEDGDNQYFDYYSVRAQTDPQLGLTASAQYAYYLTPHLKPYFKVARTSMNCTSLLVVDVLGFNSDPYMQTIETTDYNILLSSVSFGVAYEWNNGLGISIGVSSNNLNKLTLDGIRQVEYYTEENAADNYNELIDNAHDLTTSSNNIEFGLIYRIGNFTIEFLQQTANLEEVSTFWRSSGWNNTNDFPSSVGTSNFLIGYSHFISK